MCVTGEVGYPCNNMGHNGTATFSEVDVAKLEEIHDKSTQAQERLLQQKREMEKANTARKGHACSKYRDSANQDVLLVTGGVGDDGALSSTEISEDQGVIWRTVQSAVLPSARYSIQAVTYNNRLFLLGMF